MRKAVIFALIIALLFSIAGCRGTIDDPGRVVTVTTAPTDTTDVTTGTEPAETTEPKPTDPPATKPTEPEITVPEITEPDAQPLNWYAVGDSITQGVSSFFTEDGQIKKIVTTDGCWAATAAKLNGWNLTNYGVGVTGYVQVGYTGKDAVELVDSIDFSEADLVTLALGVNDWCYGVSLGSVEDDPSVQGSVCANMKCCIEKILADNSDVRIVVVSPLICTFQGTAETGWTTYIERGQCGTLYDVWEAEQEISAIYGVEFVDLLFDCESITAENAATTLPDRVHPSPEAYAALGEEMAHKLRNDD